MKILCVSDQIDPLIYNSNAVKNFPDIDLILCAGDLPMDYVDFIVSVFNKPTYFIFGNHDLKEYKYYHNVPGTNSSPAATSQTTSHFVSNNINKTDQHNHHHGAIYAGFKNLRLKLVSFSKNNKKKTPLLLTGISGSIKYNNGLCQFTENEMKFKLVKLIPGLLLNKLRYGRYIDILLTHATPYHVHDHSDPCHTGFKCFNWFIKTFKPEFMIHGHIHLYDQREERISQYHGTTVINAFAHHIITINNYVKTEK